MRRDTGGDYRIFDVSSGQTVNISGLTVTNGKSDRGAGIQNGGTLNLANCVVTGNTATVNGGGIRSSGGVMTITDSTISGNNSDTGGGIYVFGGGRMSQSPVARSVAITPLNPAE